MVALTRENGGWFSGTGRLHAGSRGEMAAGTRQERRAMNSEPSAAVLGGMLGPGRPHEGGHVQTKYVLGTTH